MRTISLSSFALFVTAAACGQEARTTGDASAAPDTAAAADVVRVDVPARSRDLGESCSQHVDCFNEYRCRAGVCANPTCVDSTRAGIERPCVMDLNARECVENGGRVIDDGVCATGRRACTMTISGIIPICLRNAVDTAACNPGEGGRRQVPTIVEQCPASPVGGCRAMPSTTAGILGVEQVVTSDELLFYAPQDANTARQNCAETLHGTFFVPGT